MTQELELDCLDQLEAIPAILRGLMCDLSVKYRMEARARPLFGSGCSRIFPIPRATAIEHAWTGS